jgi:TolB-like protein
MNSFFRELKQRKVYRVALGYAVVAWLVIQISATVMPAYNAPEWILPTFITVIALGFPVALVLAWAFEVKGGVIEKTPESTGSLSTANRRRVWLVAAAGLIISAIAVGGYWIWHPWRNASRVSEPTTAATSSKQSGSVELPTKSIAVLPFENFSEDKAFAFFADGVHDEILNDLAKIADLKVISRTSVMQYKNTATRNLPEIAQGLKVAHVLEGSVQRSGNRVRVSAQLIDARNDTHVWVEKYDRDLADVFAIQSEIAQKIADQLQAKLSPTQKSAMNERPTSDLAAYDLYLRAKELIYDGEFNPSRRREDFFKAVQLLDQAIVRDPAFLLAHCQLAYMHDSIYFYNFDHTETRLALAETSVKAAVRLEPQLRSGARGTGQGATCSA